MTDFEGNFVRIIGVTVSSYGGLPVSLLRSFGAGRRRKSKLEARSGDAAALFGSGDGKGLVRECILRGPVEPLHAVGAMHADKAQAVVDDSGQDPPTASMRS